MKNQTQLDPELLKYHRETAGLTQTQLAQIVMKKSGDSDDKKASRLSMYYVIEKTGRTGPVRAKRIALALGCNVEDLQNPTDALFRPWWVEVPNDANGNLGTVVFGHQNVIRHLEENWPKTAENVLEMGKEVTARLRLNENRYQLTIASPDLNYNWQFEFCACVITKETGIRWVLGNKWEQSFLIESLKDLLFKHANTVWIDSQKYPEEGKIEVIQSLITENDPDSPWGGVLENEQIFRNWKDFYVSFKEFSKRYPENIFDIKTKCDGFEIRFSEEYRKQHQERHDNKKCFTVRQGWLDDKEEFQVGPFPLARISQEMKQAQQIREIPILWEHDEPAPFGTPTTNFLLRG